MQAGIASSYARRERARGVELARPVHDLSLELGGPIIVEVRFKRPLFEASDDYFRDKVLESAGRQLFAWSDEIATGRVRDVDWTLARRILAKDFVYFGSSRMIELLTGAYVHEADHSMAAKWRPYAARPFWADAVYHASVVSWRSDSDEAVDQKSGHFRRILNRAEGQLPKDRPGVVHVGFESLPTPGIAANRHLKNLMEAWDYGPKNPRLRWVYANYFVPELTTRRDESWALTETMAPYKIGRHRTEWPLPGHMLLTPEDGADDGVFWAALS